MIKKLALFLALFAPLSSAFAGSFVYLGPLLESTAGEFLLSRSTLATAARGLLPANVAASYAAAKPNQELARMVGNVKLLSFGSELRTRLNGVYAEFELQFPGRTRTVFEGRGRLRVSERKFLETKLALLEPGTFAVFSPSKTTGAGFAQAAENYAAQKNSIRSIEEWRALPEAERDTLLRNSDPASGITTQDYGKLSEIRAAKSKAFAQAILEQSGREIPSKDYGDFDEHVTIGAPVPMFEIYTLADGEIVGGRVIYRQLGTDSKRYKGGHFATIEEALKVFVRHPNTTDVSWVWSYTMDTSGRGFPCGDNRWEWTGY